MRRAIPAASAAAFLLCLTFLTGCVAPRRVSRNVVPPEPVESNPYAGDDLYLRAFVLKNKGGGDSEADVAALKTVFIQYLTSKARFGKVIDATDGRTQIPPSALSLTMELQPSLRDERYSYFKTVLGLYLLYAVTPRSGTVTVSGHAVLQRGGKTISLKSWTATNDYSYMFYGMFRNGPIHEMFRAAYEDVFAHVSIPIQVEGGPGLSKSELESLVKTSVEKATKVEEKVYNSDVDKASYARPEDARNFAVVVGIEKYQSITPAEFGERDAKSVREHLVALGYPQRNIVQLSGSMATKSNLEKYLEHWLPGKVTEDSRVLFYFSGHGAPEIDSKQAYLVPWDGDPKFLKETGYPLSRLYGSLRGLKAKEVIVALDSCFSGAGGRSVLPSGARPLVAKIDDAAGDMGSMVVLSASEADEIALSESKQGHGLFTYYFLKGLNERKGEASIKTLYDFLVPRVQDGARQQNRDQTPRLLSADPGRADMFLGR